MKRPRSCPNPMKTLRILFSAIGLLLAQSTSGAGVTIVTHGFQPFAGFSPRPDWVDVMGNHIASIANRSSGNAAVYEMEIDGIVSIQVSSFVQTHGLPPSSNPNSEVIIKLYW